MALYDEMIQRLRLYPDIDDEDGDLNMRAAYVIHRLQDVIRHYNPDDAIFDDEKKA